jgi:tetratricopeptide (TPR) repeat protein
MLGSDAEGDDVPPSSALVGALIGREAPRVRALGEYDASSFPPDLADQLRRREEVAAELRRLGVADRKARVEAIPRLQKLLRVYPHPLAYELLIHAYVDAGRYDEAKGVAFAARERRAQCARSAYPEIRVETDRLREWTSADIDEMRTDHQSRKPTAEH